MIVHWYIYIYYCSGSLVVWWLGFRAPSLPRPGCGCDSRSGKRGFFCHLSSLPQIFLNTGSLVCQEVHMHRTLGDQLSSCGSLSLDGLGIGDITPALVTWPLMRKRGNGRGTRGDAPPGHCFLPSSQKPNGSDFFFIQRQPGTWAPKTHSGNKNRKHLKRTEHLRC